MIGYLLYLHQMAPDLIRKFLLYNIQEVRKYMLVKLRSFTFIVIVVDSTFSPHPCTLYLQCYTSLYLLHLGQEEGYLCNSVLSSE